MEHPPILTIMCTCGCVQYWIFKAPLFAYRLVCVAVTRPRTGPPSALPEHGPSLRKVAVGMQYNHNHTSTHTHTHAHTHAHAHSHANAHDTHTYTQSPRPTPEEKYRKKEKDIT